MHQNCRRDKRSPASTFTLCEISYFAATTKNLKIINLNIYLFISYLIVSVKLDCFSSKKTENKEEVALITGDIKEPWAARQVY